MLRKQVLWENRKVIRRREEMLQKLRDPYVQGGEDIGDAHGYYIKVNKKNGKTEIHKFRFLQKKNGNHSNQFLKSNTIKYKNHLR
jgi:hypothetical protein